MNVITPPSGPSIGGVHGKELFYAKMTVGDDRVNERAGYSTRLGIGSISVNPPEFDVGDDTYTVNHWVVGDSGTLHLILTGSLTQDAAANLALYAGNEKFRFADADRVAESINSREWFGSSLSWAAGQVVPVLIVDENRKPSFNARDAAAGNRFVSQGVSGARKLQTPVTATDPDGHAVTYALEGPDADQFNIYAVTGQLFTRGDVIYGNDAGVPYRVTVRASDPYGASRTVGITIVNRFDPGGSTPTLNPGSGAAGEPFVLYWYSTFAAEDKVGKGRTVRQPGLHPQRRGVRGGRADRQFIRHPGPQGGQGASGRSRPRLVQPDQVPGMEFLHSRCV